MSERKAISKSVRFKVFARDQFTCQYCGRKPPAVTLEVDHVIAASQGGSDGEHNLLTACFDCNRGKGAGAVGVAPIDLVARAALVKERAAQIRAYERLLAKQQRLADAGASEVMDIYAHRFDGWELNEDARRSIRQFIEKLPASRVVEAMQMACSRRSHDLAFRYFCGICWNWIKEGK